MHNPATGRTLCEVADATPADGAAALNAAHAARADWAAVPPHRRAGILRRAYLEQKYLAIDMTPATRGTDVVEDRAEPEQNR